MAKKIRIAESFENVYVWGISTALSELRLVLHINKQLHIDLRRSINVMNRISLPPEGFQTFTCVIEKYDLPVRYILFVNRSNGHTLFTGCSTFDYLLVLMGSFSSHELKRTTTLLRTIEGINALMVINIETLKQDKEYFLLFD
ncbi:MAG: hypothetical protein ACP5PS_02100 [Bacteroidales bacterium]